MLGRIEIITSLSNSPLILEELINSIPESELCSRRIPNKWNIHEHACHMAQAESMILDRFKSFFNITNPSFEPYLPGTTEKVDSLIDMDLKSELATFKRLRGGLIQLISRFDERNWKNEGTHNEYKQYNPEILLRHTLMHDHFHMYRIEELWLTKDEYLA